MKTASFFKDYSPAALAIVLSFFIVMGPQSSAATDDNAFNDCLQRYARISEIQLDQVWKNSPVPEDIKESMPSYPLVESFIRWTKVRNPNGTTTVIVMARGAGPQDEDTQDGFYVLLQSGDRIDLADNIAENAAFFAKQSSHGIYGIFFCTQGDLGSQESLLWNGQSRN